MDIIVFSIFGIYSLVHLIMFFGLLVNSGKPRNKSLFEPLVSIVICAKDEEDSIEDCIKSLLNLNYPSEKLEIVLVNDRSADRTGEIMQSYSGSNSHIKYLEIKEVNGKLKGKANALALALKIASGELIFTTDADIEVNKNWIREITRYYDKNTGVVAGFSVIRPQKFSWALQSVDWLYLLSVASGGDGIGIPISCVGNNMSYRKKGYDEIGGYESIQFSITEDFLLLHKIHQKGYKTKFPVNNDTKNITLPCLTLSQLFRQKKRWAMGGLGVINMGMFIGLLGWLTGAVLLTGWAYMDINTYVAVVFSKLVTDFIFLFPAVKEFKMWKIYLYLVFFEIYYAAYVIITSLLLAIDRKVVWKDQKI